MKNIIIVDDDEISIFITSKIIQGIDKSVNILGFTNPLEALKHLIDQMEEPDAILLDINMPFIDGFEFIEQLKVNKNAMVNKISAFSASCIGGLDRDTKRMLELGVDKFISKPMCKEQFYKMIDTKIKAG